MLLVPTVLAPSPIQGIGLFTPSPIAAGTTIWVFDPTVDWRLGAHEIESFPEPYRGRLREWSYEEAGGAFVVCGDSAKFMNHSFDPNCLDAPDVTLARRDIAAGEELTCDYRLIDAESARTGLREWWRPAGQRHATHASIASSSSQPREES